MEAVLFDMDGLILDSERVYDRAMAAAGSSLGYVLDECFLKRTRGVNAGLMKNLEMVFLLKNSVADIRKSYGRFFKRKVWE